MKYLSRFRYWWVAPLLVFDSLYYLFVQLLIDQGPEGKRELSQVGELLRPEPVFSTFLISLLSIGLVQLSRRGLDRTNRLGLPAKYLLTLGLSFVSFVAILGGGLVLIEYSMGHMRPPSYYINNLIVLVFLHLLVSNGAIAIGYFRESRRLAEELLQVEKQRTEQELRSLQQQMSPHFLFNNLNTLLSLIPIDPAGAVRFTEHLSQVYRHAAQHAQTEVVTLQEELAFLRAYYGLLQQRFGEAYQLTLEVGEIDPHNYVLVPFAMQTLLENMVKHNVAHAKSPLVLTVLVQGESLRVENLRYPKPEVTSSGVGLRNLQQQFAHLTDRPMEVMTSESHFRVILPLIPLVKP